MKKPTKTAKGEKAKNMTLEEIDARTTKLEDEVRVLKTTLERILKKV